MAQLEFPGPNRFKVDKVLSQNASNRSTTYQQATSSIYSSMKTLSRVWAQSCLNSNLLKRHAMEAKSFKTMRSASITNHLKLIRTSRLTHRRERERERTLIESIWGFPIESFCSWMDLNKFNKSRFGGTYIDRFLVYLSVHEKKNYKSRTSDTNCGLSKVEVSNICVT